MMIAADNAIQNATTPARRSVHQTSFLWALVQAMVRSTTPRCPAVIGAGHLDQLVEDQPVRDARPVAAQRMWRVVRWQQRFELVPERLDDG